MTIVDVKWPIKTTEVYVEPGRFFCTDDIESLQQNARNNKKYEGGKSSQMIQSVRKQVQHYGPRFGSLAHGRLA